MTLLSLYLPTSSIDREVVEFDAAKLESAESTCSVSLQAPDSPLPTPRVGGHCGGVSVAFCRSHLPGFAESLSLPTGHAPVRRTTSIPETAKQIPRVYGATTPLRQSSFLKRAGDTFAPESPLSIVAPADELRGGGSSVSGRVARRLVGVGHQRAGYYITSCVSLGSMVIPTLWSVEAASGPFKSTRRCRAEPTRYGLHGVDLAI